MFFRVWIHVQNTNRCLKHGKQLIFSARCNIYISRLCYDVSDRLSVCLSATEVHWRVIAKLGSNSDPNLPRIVVAGRGNLNINISRYASHCQALLYVHAIVAVLFLQLHFYTGRGRRNSSCFTARRYGRNWHIPPNISKCFIKFLHLVDVGLWVGMIKVRDVEMVTNRFWGPCADVKIDHLHSLLWRSKTNCNITM